eukprot:scaffold2312_cov165-Ochromonas_danica.AAC.65
MLLKAKTVNDLADSKKEGGSKSVNTSTPAGKPPASGGGPTTSTPAPAKESAQNNDSKPTLESKESSKPAPPQLREVARALSGGIADAIVDMRCSVNEQQETDLSRNGYVQLLQDSGGVRRSMQTSSTFGNRSSLWVWRRSFGTCSGRFKPIVDIMLDSSSVSSDLVLAGFVCDPTPIAGQYLWMKSATSEEDEKDAIVDLYITTGKMRNTSDPIWQSPGVGWIRVEGNFSKSLFGSLDTFLWYRPARTRSAEAMMANPLRGTIALPDEIRMPKLIAAVRLALRHYLPVSDVKRLANLLLDGAQLSTTTSTSIVHNDNIRSERMMDYSSLFHRYETKRKLSASRWARLVTDVGLRMRASDCAQIFQFIDLNNNGFITLDEFTRFLSLTDFELDLVLEKMRRKLLTPCQPRTRDGMQTAQKTASPATAQSTLGIIGALNLISNNQIGKQRIREGRVLQEVFRTVNRKKDDILSLDEIMDLAAKTEIFLTEEEGRKLLAMLDINGDDIVDENDFLATLRRDGFANAITRKAFRIRETAAMLRRWLVRGSSEKGDGGNSAMASKEQWRSLKRRYERATGQRCPGFLNAPALQHTVASLGVCISAVEARELALVIAPEKNGRVHLSELQAFMTRSCRAFGELLAVFEQRLGELVEAYRACNQAKKSTGKEDVDLTLLYRRKLDDVKRKIDYVYSLSSSSQANSTPGGNELEREGDGHNQRVVGGEDDDEDEDVRPQPLPVATPDPRLKSASASHEVISFAQLRAGLIFVSPREGEIGCPNLEELACLSILVDADVVQGDVFGVRLRAFLDGIVSYIVKSEEEQRLKAGSAVSLDFLARDLKRQIYYEARAHSKNKRNADYHAVFDLFDTNGNGFLSLDELKAMLRRLQLVNALPEHQMPALLAMIDKKKSGQVTYEDFIAFAEDGKTKMTKGDGEDGDEEEEAVTAVNEPNDVDDGDDGEVDGAAAVTAVPPVVISKNADCDWLAWFLYRQACHLDPIDPESVLTDLEARCAETEMTQNKSYVTVKDLWNILFELGLQTALTKAQFTKGVLFLCSVGHGHDEDRVDYQALCKFAVRMGRAYRSKQQEQEQEIEKTFPPLLVELKKYFKDLCEEQITKGEPLDVPRYEKIFRRIDADGDGMLSPKEFRVALKRLHYKNVKAWTQRMIRRLFDECDRNRDGLLSIKEFSNYILDREPDNSRKTNAVSKPNTTSSKLADRGSESQKKGAETDRLNLSDDEDDEVFSRRRRLTDHELMRKVSDLLQDIVPIDSSNMVKHWEVVRAAVRRFFQRSDPELKGIVSEERFRAFLRRSGLQDNLTASELRRLTEKLKRKTSIGGEVQIDYEK